MTKRAFGELEAQILYILRSKKMTVKEVHQALGGTDNYNTVMTVMSRLAEKKKLERQKVGLQYEYRLNSDPVSFSFLDKLKQKFAGLKTSAVVSHLIESANDLTDDDLAEMEQIVQKLREKRK